MSLGNLALVRAARRNSAAVLDSSNEATDAASPIYAKASPDLPSFECLGCFARPPACLPEQCRRQTAPALPCELAIPAVR